jgi:hypothetical protein
MSKATEDAGRFGSDLSEGLGPLVECADKLRTLLFGLRDSDPGCNVGATLERWSWLKEDATAEQWERASHALDADVEIDAMRRGA